MPDGSPMLASETPELAEPMPHPNPVSEFQEGQWWLKELDAMVADGTPDQRRAMAVVRHLLRSAHLAAGVVDDKQRVR